MGPAGRRSTYALPECATSGGAIAMAGRTAVPSFGSDDMLGIKSSGSSGGSAATVSMALPLALVASEASSLSSLETVREIWRPRAPRDLLSCTCARARPKNSVTAHDPCSVRGRQLSASQSPYSFLAVKTVQRPSWPRESVALIH